LKENSTHIEGKATLLLHIAKQT